MLRCIPKFYRWLIGLALLAGVGLAWLPVPVYQEVAWQRLDKGKQHDEFMTPLFVLPGVDRKKVLELTQPDLRAVRVRVATYKRRNTSDFIVELKKDGRLVARASRWAAHMDDWSVQTFFLDRVEDKPLPPGRYEIHFTTTNADDRNCVAVLGDDKQDVPVSPIYLRAIMPLYKRIRELQRCRAYKEIKPDTPTVKTLWRGLLIGGAALIAAACLLPEAAGHGLILAAMTGLFIWGSNFSPGDQFGINQLAKVGPTATTIIIIAVGGLMFWLRRGTPRLLVKLKPQPGRRGTIYLVAISLIFSTLFYLLRNNFLNGDAPQHDVWIRHLVPIKGAYTYHDEMWTLYLHSKFWWITTRLWGWSTLYSFQVLSSLVGGVYIFGLLLFCRQAGGDRAGGLFALMLAAGFNQLFFGDVESYVMVAAAIVFYLRSAHLAATEDRSIVRPAAWLALAMGFHVLAGWLLPSLAVLFIHRMSRNRRRETALGLAAFGGVIAATLVYFHYTCLPLKDWLWHSHMSSPLRHLLGLKTGGYLPPTNAAYNLELANLIILLFPWLLTLVPLIRHGRVRLNLNNIFLLAAAGFGLMFVFSWNAGLGVYDDWNLYAPAFIAVAWLTWFNFQAAADLPGRSALAAGYFIIGAANSYAWIIGNHFLLPAVK